MKEYIINWYWYNEDENKEPVKICYNKCEDYDKMIRFLYWCREYEIEYTIRNDSDKLLVDEEFIQSYIGGRINEIDVEFGGDDCLPVINVYIGF